MSQTSESNSTYDRRMGQNTFPVVATPSSPAQCARIKPRETFSVGILHDQHRPTRSPGCRGRVESGSSRAVGTKRQLGDDKCVGTKRRLLGSSRAAATRRPAGSDHMTTNSGRQAATIRQLSAAIERQQ